jgi:hypothetical protein
MNLQSEGIIYYANGPRIADVSETKSGGMRLRSRLYLSPAKRAIYKGAIGKRKFIFVQTG